MWELRALRRMAEPHGFTLLEVLVSIAVLSIGLLSAALLMSITYKSSVRSRYMAEAAQLASEKLEDLGRYPAQISNAVVYPDAHIFVPSGSTCQITASTTGTNCVGSLAPALTCSSPGVCTFNTISSTYSPLSITANQSGAGGTEANSAATVSYSDAVYLSATNGTVQETYQTAGGSSPTYATLTYSPNGATPVPSTSSTPPGNAGETFDRRWVIEQDEPVAGVRRITVLVTLMDQTVQPPVTYQMTMVRP
ncbi:MAG: prepilin-type N-terminal cleavage/methylation domain-containing protein [Terriglobia bacterium]